MLEGLDADEMYWLARDDRRINEAIESSSLTASAGPARSLAPSVEDIVKRASRGYKTGKVVNGEFIVELEVPEVTFWHRLKQEFVLLVCTTDEKSYKVNCGKS